jgi:hypothetical protein
MGQGPFKLSHHNGGTGLEIDLAANTPLELTFDRMCHGVWIMNLDATASLNVSFDGGANFFAVPKSTSFWWDGIVLQRMWFESTVAHHSFNMVTKEG